MRTTATRAAFLVLLAGLAACARRPSVPSPGPGADVRAVELQNGFVSVRIERPPGASGPRPAVISLLGEREQLLGAGLVVVTYSINWDLLKPLTPPGPPPPTTVGVWLLAAPTPRTVGEGYFRIIAANARQAVPVVLDHLATLPEIDAARIGIAGTSTNGFIALEAAADPRLAAAAVIAACGDYHRFLRLSNLAMNGRPLELDPAYDTRLRHQEPVRHASAFTHAAILMLNGVDDQAVPVSCALTTARALRAAYRRAEVPERFRFVPVSGAGHTELAQRAREETLAWLHRWLLAPAPPGG